MHIWLFSGYAGSGKSTSATLLKNILEKKASVAMYAFATRVKDEVATIYQVQRDLCDTQEGKHTVVITEYGQFTIRQLLINHSAFRKRESNDDAIWASYVANDIKNDSAEHVIIHDWRYCMEYDTLKEHFPQAEIHTIRVMRDGVVSFNDPSEHDLDHFRFDTILQNNGTLEECTQSLRSQLSV